MSMRSTILEQMRQIAREQGKTLRPLKEETALADCGLDSLGFAVLVARLEDMLRVDPFSTTEEATPFPKTFGEFVKVYEKWGDLKRLRLR